MGKTMDVALERLGAKLQSFDGTAKFVMEGEGTIIADGQGVREGDGDADVILTATPEVFRSILEGEMNPTTAFMTGKLKIDGSMPMAMQLGAALS